MSKLSANVQTGTYSIKTWLGVNECPDGDTRLKNGEAAKMRNFRITRSGSLKKRPGLERAARLLSGVEALEGEETVILTETNVTEFEAETYASVSISDMGGIKFNGAAVTVSYANWQSCAGRYMDAGNLGAYRLTRCVYKTGAAGTVHVDGGCVSLAQHSTAVRGNDGYLQDGFDNIVGWAQSVRIRDGKIGLVEPTPLASGSYFMTRGGEVYKYDELRSTAESGGVMYYFGYPLTLEAEDSWTWYAAPVTAQSGAGGIAPVRALWSGRVGENEVLAAACGGHLWSIAKTEDGWTRTELGAVDTSGHVGLLGFDRKLYVLDGVKYRVWDGQTLTEVEGYVPCVVTAASPSGGGQTYEGINKLTPKRRQRFSSDGEAKVFVLSEKNLSGIDKVTVNGAVTTDYTPNAADGTVSFTEAPAAGASNVEVWYTADLTAAAAMRAEVTAKRYSELFNGANDNRVFIYGDGTNEALFCGLTEAGKPSAEYFPDLNEVAIGEANTPLTALVRHYNRLLAFKPNGAFSIAYGTVTFEDGTSNGGFYVTPVNRTLGCDAYGQAVLVENRPRTLDARNILEWRGSSTGGNITNDTRNAQAVGLEVGKTLADFDFSQTFTFFDKLSREYYAVCSGAAAVQATESGAWYVYTDFPVCAMALYGDELYAGCLDGSVCRVSEGAHTDMGRCIDAYWESGSISFGRDFKRKYSPVMWLGLRPEKNAGITAGIITDETALTQQEVRAPEDAPRVVKLRLKSKRFNYYKLVFGHKSEGAAATVNTVDVRVRFTGDVM